MADRKVTELTELTAPVATDVFPVIDVSEAENANKNKKIQLTTILKNIPNGTVSAPSVSFVDDSGLTGFFRVASNEIGISANQTLIGSFTTTGFQLGSGTPAAQLHLFSTDTTDQVIIENSDTGADNAPDLVLFRNSSSPAANDNLGNLLFRANDAAGNAHDYASIVASIETTTNGSEDGVLDIMSSASGTLASRIRLLNDKVGIGETTPLHPLHLTSTAAGIAFQIESSADDAASGADLMLVHRRGASGAGQDNDVLSTIFYRGKNDNSTPEEVDYAAIQSVIIDASDGTEDGKLNLQVMTAGTLTTKLAVDATGIDITGTVIDDGATHDGDVTFTGASANIVFDKSDNALEFADNAKATFGADADLQIFHDGSQSVIKDNGTGQLLISGENTVAITNAAATENYARFIKDGAAELYHNNVKKIQTSATGVDIPEDFIAGSGSKLTVGASGDLTFFHDSTNSYVQNNTGDLILGDTNHQYFRGNTSDKSVSLYFNGSEKAKTTSSGVTVTGTVTDDGAVHDGDVTFTGTSANVVFDKSDDALEFADNAKATFGSAGDLELSHNGTHSFIKDTGTGSLFVLSDSFKVNSADFSENMIVALENSFVKLFFDGSEKLVTTSSGITVTGTVTETSDIAFKSDIEPITNTLDKLQQITGYKYKLDNASIDSMGVIAQDVEKVFPELVHGNEGSKTLQYSGLIGVLVEAVKDLSAKVKALESN